MRGRINEPPEGRKRRGVWLQCPLLFLYRSPFELARKGDLCLTNARLLILGLLVAQTLAFTACETIKSRFARQTLPDLGAPIALTVRMDVDPSLSEAKTQYTDGCSRIQMFSIGPTVEDLLVQAAHQTFRTVLIAGGNTTAGKPDVTVRVRMLDPRLKIQADGLYDRMPRRTEFRCLR